MAGMERQKQAAKVIVTHHTITAHYDFKGAVMVEDSMEKVLHRIQKWNEKRLTSAIDTSQQSTIHARNDALLNRLVSARCRVGNNIRRLVVRVNRLCVRWCVL
jgi:hypothetical protein